AGGGVVCADATRSCDTDANGTNAITTNDNATRRQPQQPADRDMAGLTAPPRRERRVRPESGGGGG
ncbi:MAG: hypothetical protein OXF75_05040, partial [Acidimicrobiaceae bacterium]|nr:hypothetical protein [Acidimicrobiaceae bacterium]